MTKDSKKPKKAYNQLTRGTPAAFTTVKAPVNNKKRPVTGLGSRKAEDNSEINRKRGIS